jgi:hypothetical protein
VAKEDTEKLAFSVRSKKYEFLVTPFGLKDSPYTFMMLMNRVLGEAKWAYCLSYVDDLVVYTKNDFDLHLAHLQDVFSRLTKANLRLKVAKCSFAAASIKFLAHVVGRHGLSPDPAKISAVRELARPETKKQIRRFWGMTGFYRNLTPWFSIIAAPLHEQTKNSRPQKVVWSKDCDQALVTLKDAVVSHPVLRLPDFSLPFILECDASRVGVRAALMQENDSQRFAVAYGSRLNNQAQRNYSIFDLELLAVVFGVTKYRPYLFSRHFTIYTDHLALKHLMGISRPSGRLARWQVFLSE